MAATCRKALCEKWKLLGWVPIIQMSNGIQFSSNIAADATGNDRDGGYFSSGLTYSATGPFIGTNAVTFDGSTGRVNLPMMASAAAKTVSRMLNTMFSPGMRPCLWNDVMLNT